MLEYLSGDVKSRRGYWTRELPIMLTSKGAADQCTVKVDECSKAAGLEQPDISWMVFEGSKLGSQPQEQERTQDRDKHKEDVVLVELGP